MEKMAIKRVLAGAVVAVLLFTVAGCTGAQEQLIVHDDSLQRVMIDKGQLIIGLDADFPPMGFIDESGEIAGFDVDVAQAVCDRLGIRLVKKAIDWNNKETILNSGEIDCIWSAMSATPARAEAMNLSEPYMQNELIFLVPCTSDAKTPNDLRGGKVGMQPYTSEQETIKASDLYGDIAIVYGDTYPELMQQMQDGKLDAVFTDSVLAYYWIFTGSEPFYVLSDSLGEDGYVIGFRKDDKTLRDKVQQIINEMSADGTLGEISKKWFGCDITIAQ